MLNAGLDFRCNFLSLKTGKQCKRKIDGNTHSASGNELLCIFYGSTGPFCTVYAVDALLESGKAGEGKIVQEAQMTEDTWIAASNF